LHSCAIKALFIIAKAWKQFRCPITDEWIKKMWYIHTMVYFSVIKRNKIISFVGKWIELKIIMVSEIIQAQKD
jgi:hypothetical protein